MGLGKTVQTIAFLSHLAEVIGLTFVLFGAKLVPTLLLQGKGIWGPFLVVAPTSTLHNWQQEFSKFYPDFKVFLLIGNH